MAVLPWENGTFMPWMVGSTFVGPDGATYQTYPDPASPTGYTAKRTDQNGTSFVSVNPPNNPNAAAEYWEGTPYGQRVLQAERAQATQNQFNNDLAGRRVGVEEQNADTSFYNAETSRQNAATNEYTARTGRYSAESDRAYKEALVKQAAEDLAFKYHQQAQDYELKRGTLGLNTAQLGASLIGPRRWDTYLETAAQAGQNPILNQAMNTWSSLTNVRPNTGAVSGPLPQKFGLDSLLADFTGGGVSGQAGARDANLDAVAQGRAPAPGWWQGLSGSEQERARGYWETRGWDPNSVLNSLSYTAIGQGLRFSGV